MPMDSMSISNRIQIHIFFSQAGLDEQTILINLVGVIDLHSLSGAVRVLLLQSFDFFLLSHCGGAVGVGFLRSLRFDAHAVVSRFVAERVVGRSAVPILEGLGQEGIRLVSFDRQLRVIIPFCIGIFGGECGLGGVLGRHPKFLPGLSPHVFLISIGLLELQLQRLLYLFSRRS